MDKLAEALLGYIAFLLSASLHEASHALAAYKPGDKTADEGGQLTLISGRRMDDWLGQRRSIL